MHGHGCCAATDQLLLGAEESLQVRTQIVAQLVTWAATFVVIRLLAPSDYGLFAMTQVILVFLNLMNGYGFASALVRTESVDRRRIAQVFGMLLLLNGALAVAQLLMAPLAAAYFRQPILVDMLRVQALLYAATPFIAKFLRARSIAVSDRSTPVTRAPPRANLTRSVPMPHPTSSSR